MVVILTKIPINVVWMVATAEVSPADDGFARSLLVVMVTVNAHVLVMLGRFRVFHFVI